MYEVTPDPYAYDGTTVLKNLLDLTDQDELTAFEADAVTQRAAEPLPHGELDARHYRAVHHHLFQDVYPWAGDFRTVRLSRDRSAFCYPEYIAAELERVFDRLGAENHLTGLSANEFAESGARFLSELNAIHAFREGNGRTQMAFFAMLANQAGHPLDLSRLVPEVFLPAMIAAFNGRERLLAAQIGGLI